MPFKIPLEDHWAVGVICKADRDQIVKIIREFEFRQKIGLPGPALGKNARALLVRLAMAYEIAAQEETIDLIDAKNPADIWTGKTPAAGYAFDIRAVTTEIPEDAEERFFYVLKMASLAYCGGRHADLQDWLTQNEHALIATLPEDALWDKIVLCNLFNCWVRLFRKDGIDRIPGIIDLLRVDQKVYESACLNAARMIERQRITLRIVSLYCLAKATEILAEFLLGTRSDAPVDVFFNAAIDAAAASSNARHEAIYCWLYAAAKTMIEAK